MKTEEITQYLVENKIYDHLLDEIKRFMDSPDLYINIITIFYLQTQLVVRPQLENEIKQYQESLKKLQLQLSETTALTKQLGGEADFELLNSEPENDLPYPITAIMVEAGKNKIVKMTGVRDRLQSSIKFLMERIDEANAELARTIEFDKLVNDKMRQQSQEASRQEVHAKEYEQDNMKSITVLNAEVAELEKLRAVMDAELTDLKPRRDQGDKKDLDRRKKSLSLLDTQILELRAKHRAQLESHSRSCSNQFSRAIEKRNEYANQFPSDSLIFFRLYHYRTGKGGNRGATSNFITGLMNYYANFRAIVDINGSAIKSEDIKLTDLLYSLFCEVNNACFRMHAICDSSAGRNREGNKIASIETSVRDFIDAESVALRIELYRGYLDNTIKLLNQFITFLQGHLKGKFEINDNDAKKPKNFLSFFSVDTSEKWNEIQLEPFKVFVTRLTEHQDLLKGLTVEEIRTYISDKTPKTPLQTRRFSAQTTMDELNSRMARVDSRRGSGPDARATRHQSFLIPDDMAAMPDVELDEPVEVKREELK